ncbi:neuronal acetylcholine receptor subunit alpha-7, partial [Nephila pilipes]
TDDSLFPTSNTMALLYSDGTVMWVPFFQIKSRCPRQKKQEMSYFDCNIRIGSWTYSSDLLNPLLDSTEVDLSNFQDTNNKWKLMSARTNRESKYYPCCVEEYPLINFNVTLKRRFI